MHPNEEVLEGWHVDARPRRGPSVLTGFDYPSMSGIDLFFNSLEPSHR
jgi:hypothetical protein